VLNVNLLVIDGTHKLTVHLKGEG